MLMVFILNKVQLSLQMAQFLLESFESDFITACAVVERRRGKQSDPVSIYKGRSVGRMNNNGWRKVRELIGLEVWVHD